MQKFAIINLFSAWVWASITILLAWYFGEQIWKMVTWAEEHWYYAAIIIIAFYPFYYLVLNKWKKLYLKIKGKIMKFELNDKN